MFQKRFKYYHTLEKLKFNFTIANRPTAYRSLLGGILWDENFPQTSGNFKKLRGIMAVTGTILDARPICVTCWQLLVIKLKGLLLLLLSLQHLRYLTFNLTKISTIFFPTVLTSFDSTMAPLFFRRQLRPQLPVHRSWRPSFAARRMRWSAAMATHGGHTRGPTPTMCDSHPAVAARRQ